MHVFFFSNEKTSFAIRTNLSLRKVAMWNPNLFYLVYDLTCIVNTEFQIWKITNFHNKSRFTEEQAQNVSVAWPGFDQVTTTTTKGTNHYTITASMATVNNHTIRWKVHNCRKVKNCNKRDIIRVAIFTTNWLFILELII